MNIKDEKVKKILFVVSMFFIIKSTIFLVFDIRFLFFCWYALYYSGYYEKLINYFNLETPLKSLMSKFNLS